MRKVEVWTVQNMINTNKDEDNSRITNTKTIFTLKYISEMFYDVIFQL